MIRPKNFIFIFGNAISIIIQDMILKKGFIMWFISIRWKIGDQLQTESKNLTPVKCNTLVCIVRLLTETCLNSSKLMIYLGRGVYLRTIHKWHHPLRGGGSAKRWRYSISLFSKMGTRGREGSKISKNGWRHLWTAPKFFWRHQNNVFDKEEARIYVANFPGYFTLTTSRESLFPKFFFASFLNTKM